MWEKNNVALILKKVTIMHVSMPRKILRMLRMLFTHSTKLFQQYFAISKFTHG